MQRNRFDLSGKSALVTGSAQGLGKAMAKALGEAGAAVVIADLNEQAARATAQEFREMGGDFSSCFIDVTDRDTIRQAVAFTVEKYGKIDIWVNNAGIFIEKYALDITVDEMKHILDVDLVGVFSGACEAARAMKETGGGSIINISSVSGFISNYSEYHVPYSAAKSGVIHMTRSMAAEWAPYNIRVNGIAPGIIPTGVPQSLALTSNETLVNEAECLKKWDYRVEMPPMHRMGTPDDLAGATVFLASEEASGFITGFTILVDGGMTIH